MPRAAPFRAAPKLPIVRKPSSSTATANQRLTTEIGGNRRKTEVVLTALQQHVANDPSLTLEITQYSKGTWIFGDRARYGIKIDGPVEKLDLVKAWLQSRLDP